MELKINGIKELERIGKEFPKAAASALNKTMAQTKTQAVRSITQRYRIKRADVMAKMGDTKRASPNKLKTWFISSGRRISYAYFGAKQFARGVRVRISKGGKQQLVPHMFLATVHGKGGQSTHEGGFLRKGKKRLPIKEFTGPSVPQMLSGVYDQLKAFAYQKLPEVLRHEIEWRMKKGK